MTASIEARATDATIGLYRDSNGYSCSFNGDDAGIVTAYVVIQPGSSGIRAVRFSAPIPSCFKATFVGESAPDVFAFIGSSQTGISISSRNCETQPFYALEIQYMVAGGTTSCCEFPLLADPLTGMLEAVDCSFNSTPISSMVSHFNANESCPCGDIYQAPLAPSDPYPANYAAAVELDPVLSWMTPADPGGLGLSYDLYFGSELPPPLVASDVMVTGPTSYAVGHLSENAIYYWRVVLRNFAGKETTGPLWVFTTKTALPPTVMNVSPADGSITLPSPTLTWNASDPEGGPLHFDVYLGLGSPPPLFATNVTAMTYSPGALFFGVSYFWRIVAHDIEGMETSGPTWSFTTGTDPSPTVTNLRPVCGSTGVELAPTLTWQATEGYGQSMKYDVFFGSGPTPPLVASNISVKSYAPSGLAYATTYTWRVLARDSGGQQTLSELCEFTTTSDPPPTVTNLAPPCGSTRVPLTQMLTWEASDPFGQSMTYDVYLGTSSPMPRVATGLSSKSYTPSNLVYSTTYFWRVVAHDAGGQQASSESCSFTTKAPNESPFIPSNPSPADNATNVNTATTFSWQCVDPEGEELRFDVFLGKIPAPPANATIGIYSDAVGATCSLGNPSGLTTLYVVVKPHGPGITGVRFSSPAPGCFGAVYLYDTVPSPLVSIGSSQTGISISSPTCQDQAFVALQMGFMASASTTACCEFAVAPDPFTGRMEAVDCAFADVPISTVVSYLNSNTTCRCDSQMRQIAFSIKQKSTFFGSMEPSSYYQWQVIARDPALHQTTGPLWTFQTRPNQPPSTPSSPSPANGAVNVVANTTLSWQCSDPESQQIKYDVYFGTSNPPPLVKTAATSNSYYPGALAWVTTYWWKIVARDTYDATSSSPTWSFTTKPANMPPNAPVLSSPANGATDLPVNTTLSWSGSDPEGQALKYDVYLGTAATPPLVASNVTGTEFIPDQFLVSTTYRWRIVARDTGNLETSSATWSFRTSSSSNLAPHVAGNPAPPDGGSTEKTTLLLEWYTYDPEQDPLTYTILGTDQYGSYVFSGQTTVRQFSVGPLQKYMTYYWTVDVYDGHWYVRGPRWSFFISGGGIPVLVSSFDAKPQRDRVDVRWELSSDEEMDRFTLLRRDGAANAVPHTVAEGAAAVKGSFSDTGVEPGKTYRYELVVRAVTGGEFRSAVVTVNMPDFDLTLYQNQPNPFNPQTTIRYDLPGRGGAVHVRLMVVDLAGRRVRTLVDETQPAGSRSVVWNGRDDSGQAVSSGVYFYVLDAGKQRLTKKLVLLK